MSRLTLLALAWFTGLSLAARPASPSPFLVIVSLLVLVGLVALGRRLRLAPLVVLAVVGLGYGRGWLADWRPALDAWRPLFDQEVLVTGMVDEDPVSVKGLVTVRLLVDRVERDGRMQPLAPVWPAHDPRAPVCQAVPWVCAPGAAVDTPPWLPGWTPAIQARVNVDSLPQGEGERLLRYGHRLTLAGKLRQAPEFDLFPYRQTLARDGVYARMTSVKAVKEVEGNGGFPVRVGALALRRQLDRIIQELLPRSPREAGLLAGILLGLQNRLPPELMEDLRTTSLSHIVVVSGFNITILAIGIGGLLYAIASVIAWLADLALKYRRFKVVDGLVAAQRLCLPTSISYVGLHVAALGAYAVFAGLDPSPVRAALMGCVYVLAKHVGRPSTMLTALAVTAWAITLTTPSALLDIGFQLSFAAVLGLVLLQPVIDPWLRVGRLVPPFDSPRRHWPALSNTLRGLVSATLAATLMTAPLLSYYFNQVSAIGLLANVLTLPVQAAIMFIGLSAVLLAWLGHGVQAAQTAVLQGVGWAGSLQTLVLTLLFALQDGLLAAAHTFSSLVWVLLRYTVAVVIGLAQAPWAAFDWRASGHLVLFMYSALGVGALSFAFALRRVSLRRLLLAPAPVRPIPLPAPAPAPVPAPAASPTRPAPASPGPASLPRLAPAQPMVALAERPGRYTTRPRRPPPRPRFRFGAPTTPVSRAPLGAVGDRPPVPETRAAPTPPAAHPDDQAAVYRPLSRPAGHPPLAAPGPHPRRPFEETTYPSWTRWFGFRYVVSLFALWAVVGLSWPLAAGRPDGLLHLTVLTPGDTVVVRTPHGERMVVGGGSWASDTNAEADRGLLPWRRGLGVLAATRFDRSYLETLNAVLARHPVRAAIAPPAPRTAAGLVWTGLAQRQAVTPLTVGERLPLTLTLDGVTLDVAAYDEVEKAVLYAVRWGEVRFVLGGGLRGPLPLAATPAAAVLVSRQARPELMTALARAYRPALWVVQADGDEDSDAPDWMDRLPAVLADRPMTLTTDGQRLWLDMEP